MSSNGDNELTYEYPAGAIADSPVPFLQEYTLSTPLFLSPSPSLTSPLCSPSMPLLPSLVLDLSLHHPWPPTLLLCSRGLRVHTPAPLTPDGQRAACQASETFVVSLTPAKRQGGQASLSLEPGAVARSEATLGAATTTTNRQWSNSNGSATTSDLRRCARCREQNQYCHGHTPIVPNPSLDLPPSQPRVPVQRSVPADSVARFNFNCAEATALAACILKTMKMPRFCPMITAEKQYHCRRARNRSCHSDVTRGGRSRQYLRWINSKPRPLISSTCYVSMAHSPTSGLHANSKGGSVLGL
jgi:hypothetical protein